MGRPKKSPPVQCIIRKPKRKGCVKFRIPKHMWPKIEAEYAAGWSITELSVRLGCNYKTLRKMFKERGITKQKGKDIDLEKTRYNNLIHRPKQAELQVQAALHAKEAEIMMLSPYEGSIFDVMFEEEES